tara:strand:+ start:144 stop:584 length:441 start_codon:yes stop_codon:yes gene_type:complete
MIEYRPFREGHLAYLKPQKVQAGEYQALVASGAASALEGGVALSGWAGLRCIGAAGLIHVRRERAVAWMILSEDAGAYMLPLAKKIRRVLSSVQYKRIELTVADGFEEGERFARLLGAKCETPEPMRFFGVDGRDERMYAIVKGTK